MEFYEEWLQVRTGYEDFPGLEALFVEYGMDLGFWGHEVGSIMIWKPFLLAFVW
jgi:hypothetical protein